MASVDIEDAVSFHIGNSKVFNMSIFNKTDIETIRHIVLELVNMDFKNTSFNQMMDQIRKTYKICPKKSQIFCMYRHLVESGEIKQNIHLESYLITKKIRALSGVLVITVVTSPGNFSCPKDCHYCPNEPGQPRSYLSDEPGVQRANRNGFDAVKQFVDRARTHYINGHPVDKIELLVLGGTWSGYPVDYQEEFIRDLFYAANTFFDDQKVVRDRLSLEDEQHINETARCKIIGLTLETRPDFITKYEIKRLRRYGCTRVQIGVQHTDDEILNKINRGCLNKHTIKAMKLLKDSGFKVDIHIMPDLPGSNPKKDMECFEYILGSPDIQADQWKIYPCEVVPWTKIEEWYKAGEYVPYSEEDLMELIIKVKTMVHPWIRLNRVIRDIPNQYIIAGNQVTNLRQEIHRIMASRDLKCNCIRCREVGENISESESAEIVVRNYESSEGAEYFISFENNDRSIIYGFARLRLSNNAGIGYLPELENAALVRELHVYGQLVAVGDSDDQAAQHYGFGKRLMKKAEQIAFENGFRKIAVISGVGVRNYYKKLGYELENTYMTRELVNHKKNYIFVIITILVIFTVFAIYSNFHFQLL